MCDIHSIQKIFRKYFLAFVEMLLMNKYHIAIMWKYLGGGIVSAL